MMLSSPSLMSTAFHRCLSAWPVRQFGFHVADLLYLLMACPVCYRTRNITTFSTLASICLWILSLTYTTLDYGFLIQTSYSVPFSSIFLLPASFLVGLFTATWKALYRSMTMRQEVKKRGRVLWALGLGLGIYTVLFLPLSQEPLLLLSQ